MFVDSGAFIEFLDRRDHYHDGVDHLFADPPSRWFSSLAVVSEPAVGSSIGLAKTRHDGLDASSLVFLDRFDIDEVWGTDRDLALEGARVIPVGA